MVVVGRSCPAPFHLATVPYLSEYLPCPSSTVGLFWGLRHSRRRPLDPQVLAETAERETRPVSSLDCPVVVERLATISLMVCHGGARAFISPAGDGAADC